jgi:DNA-directed RNA polymerase specialized sigma24 family protein
MTRAMPDVGEGFLSGIVREPRTSVYVLPADGLFPETRRDWLVEHVSGGTDRRLVANGYVMQIYAPALGAYLRSSSLRGLGEPDDLVPAFFASRLDSADFYRRWLDSGFAFRRWLLNAFHFFLHEESRRRRRDAGLPIDEESSEPAQEEDAVAQFEAQWARDVVRRACDRAREICAASGWSLHWDVFVRHHGEGRSYPEIARELSFDPRRGPNFVRTAGSVLRRAMLEVLVRDGVEGPDLEREARRLVEALRPR